MKSHAAVAAELLGDRDLVESVIRDAATSGLDSKHKALFAFLDVVNKDCASVTPAHLAGLRDVGWTDEELYFAISVCALFNFYNRWIDASGVHGLSDEAHRLGGKRSAVHGYVRE
jgi:alkylhydroperoxidase family enzyme